MSSSAHRSSSPNLSSLLITSSSPHPDQKNEEDRKKAYRPCATCYKPYGVFKFMSFKNCDDCRSKNRLKKQEADERKRMRMKARKELEARWKDVDDDVELGDVLPSMVEDMELKAQQQKLAKAKAEANALVEKDRSVVSVRDENENERMTSTGAVKRKSPKELHEMEKDEQRVVLGMIRNDLKQRVKVKGNKRVAMSGAVTIAPADGVPETADAGKEYQSASALYESLKKRVKKASNSTSSSQFLRFKGFHSIIAVNTIDHQKRLDLVAQDLRKIVRVPFGYTKPDASYDFKTEARSVSFKCTCLGYEPAPAAAPAVPSPSGSGAAPANPFSSATFSVKKAKSDLIRQERARVGLETLGDKDASGSGHAAGGNTVGIPRFCGGTVKITAVDDTRHPLEIVGQRIIVVVEHGIGHGRSK